MTLFEILLLYLHAQLFIQSWTGFQHKFGPHSVTSRVLMLFFGIMLLCVMNFYGAFHFRAKRRSELVSAHAISLFVSYILGYGVQILIAHRLGRIAPLLNSMIFSVVCSTLWVTVLYRLYHKLFPPVDLLLVYSDDPPERLLANLRRQSNAYRIAQNLPYTACDPEEPKVHSAIRNAQAVFLCDVPKDAKRDRLIELCIKLDVPVYIQPSLNDVVIRCAEEINHFHEPVYVISESGYPNAYSLCKRAFDVLFSILLLILLSPLFAIIAAAVKLQDGGPVFYRQERLTQNAKRFDMIKFRSMRTDAEDDGIARMSGARDDRVTRVGRLIRSCRMDELPQLWNILKGDMSFVGPRPERPEIAQKYEQALPEFNLRLRVKAGLTGYAQVYGAYDTDPKAKLAMDLTYISRASVVLDVAILLKTIQIVFSKESAQGVQEGR